MNEVDICNKLRRWFFEQGWDDFAEVTLAGGCVADVVAVHRNDKTTRVVEAKVGASLDLIGQAIQWVDRSHFDEVCVAVPRLRPSRSRAAFERVLRQFGVGLFVIGDDESVACRPPVQLRIEPRRRDVSSAERRFVLSKIDPEHRHYAKAGASAARRWTPFKRTCRLLRDALANSGRQGMTVREIVDAIDHHYVSASSARGSLTKVLKLGTVPELRDVEYVEGSKPWRWRLIERPPARWTGGGS